MREIQVDLALKFSIPETGLNINGVLLGLRKAIPQIFFALLKCFFTAVEEEEIEKFKKESPDRYVRNGHRARERQLRTSFGAFGYRLALLRDKLTSKTMAPLLACGFLPRYVRYSKESSEAPVGLAVHLSYRRSTAEVERICKEAAVPSARTVHRRLQDFAEVYCQWPDLKKVPYRFLMVDGTKVRLQGPRGASRPHGEMRWVLASLGEKEPFEPVGFWVGSSWAKIREDIEERLNYDGLEVLFSDGEPGIEQAFLAEGMRHQRCVLHGKRDFIYRLYDDGLKKAEQGQFREKFESLPVFRLHKESLEELSAEDIPAVREMAERTEKGLRDIVDMLDPEKYPRARAYVQNLSRSIGTFFTWWLEKGTWIALNTNAIESDFSQVKNRIWSVGKRWSDKGLLNWLHVAAAKIFFPGLWKEFWDQYIAANPLINLSYLAVSWNWY